MRLSVIVPVAVLALCAVVLAATWCGRPSAKPQPVRTGMGLLRAYACNRSESKIVLVKGMEDGFSPAGNEPGFLRPGLDKARWRSIGAGNYDQSEPDLSFYDALQAPARVRNGLFVIGLKRLGVADSNNDVIGIGDLTSRERFSSTVANLPALHGWKRDGTLYYAQLDDIVFAAPGPGQQRNLLGFLRADAQPRWVDVNVQDDTSVDFVGMAACVGPQGGRGVTLMSDERQPASGVVALSCATGPPDWPTCNQYIGDTPCGSELPVACLLPGRRPPPPGLGDAGLRPGWTGGDIALTGPVPATRFSHIGEVDAFCSARFGRGWRTLAAHEGLPNFSVSGRGHPPAAPVRAWVDEVNQPYATCWAR